MYKRKKYFPIADKPKVQYFHVIGNYIGDRYFKVDWENQTCVQIVENPGLEKSGRSHCIGVYIISMQTFNGNYYWHFGRDSQHSKMLLTTENQFNLAKDRVLNKIL